MNLNDYSELAEIIQQIDGKERILSQKASTHYEDLLFFIDELSMADPETIDRVIKQLMQDPSSRIYTSFVDRKPYISMALAYAHCNKHQSKLAIKYALETKSQFGRSISEWNKAVAHWFLGIIYRNYGEAGKDMAELELASDIFSRILEDLANATKVRNDYDISSLCQAQIDKISQTLRELPIYQAQVKTIYSISVPYGSFAKIIRKLQIPQDGLHSEWKEAMSSLLPYDLGHIEDQITTLVDLLRSPEGMEQVSRPFADIFLAHCYNLTSYATQRQDPAAEFYLSDGREIFQIHQDVYNLALAKWYLALIYVNKLWYSAAFSLLDETDNLLKMLLEEQRNPGFYKEVQNLRRNLFFVTTELKYQVASLEKEQQQRQVKESTSERGSVLRLAGRRGEPEQGQPESTRYRKNELNADQPILQLPPGTKATTATHQKSKEQKDSKKEDNVRRIQHIVIPVDVEALRELDTNSTPLEKDLIKNLQEYVQRRDGEPGKPATAPDPKVTHPTPKRRRIPSFPIYGQAAAGPNGEPNLDSADLEKTQIVYDDLCIVFGGKEYNVQFMDGAKYNFREWKRYGWLKVVGESMNDCSPIQIQDGCYVLFAENRNVDSCIMKIVVAVLPELDSQPAQLVIKRLLKLSTPLPSRADGFASEYELFLLHSESSHKNDPRTGLSYKDIEVIRNDQIVGEVIAVASPAIP